MRLKAITGIVLTVFLLGMLTLTFNVQPVAASVEIDWWPMFSHDLNHTGYSTSTAPNTNNTIWNYTTGGAVWSSPAVVDGRVYVGSWDYKVYCLDASTGAHVWNYATGGSVRSSPAVAGGRVFVGSTDAKVYAFASLEWQVESTNRVTSDYLYDRGPCLIQDIYGKFFAFFASMSLGEKYNIRSSFSDDGIVWSTPNEITEKTGCLRPSAIQDQNGTYWLTWDKDYSGIWITSSNNGINWSAPTQVTYYDNETSSWCRRPSLIQDWNGKYWLAYESSIHRPDILVRSSDDGINWQEPIQITPGLETEVSPSLTQDSNEVYWVVWCRSEGTLWVSNSTNGSNWHAPRQIVTGMSSFFPSLIQDLSGNYVMTWIDSETPNGNIWISNSSDCVNWEAPRQLTLDSRNSFPHLMQDNNGKYRVTYTSYMMGDDDIWAITLSLVHITSCDQYGNPRDIFTLGEDVYAKGSGYPTNIEVTIYVIPDGYNPIPGNAKAVTNKTTEADGTLAVILIWSHPLDLGSYDIWVDVNQNGVFDGADVWNNQSIGIYPLDVIPEFLTWTSMLLIPIILTIAVTIYKRRLLKTPIH